MITVTIRTANAAFTDEWTGEPDPAREVARILHSLAGKIENDRIDVRPIEDPDWKGSTADLRDVNGNVVGEIRVEPDR